jgi:mRNA interferase RelE/StbE
LKDTPPNLGTESRGFEIEFTSPFLKRIKALDKEAQIRILREANILKTNPYAGKSLRGEWRGIFSLRVGDYRVLYKIREEQKRVVLLAVGHRKHVYKK